MKNTLLWLLIGLTSSLGAQTLTTQVQTYEWNGATFGWQLRLSESYQYDERDSVRVTDFQSNWFGPNRNIAVRDEEGEIVKTQNYWMDENNIWVNSSRQTITEEANGNCINLTETWDEDHWIPYYRHLISKQSSELWQENDTETQTYINGAWQNQSRNIKRKDKAGRIIADTHFAWENGQWVKTYSWINEYNEQGDNIYTENIDYTRSTTDRARWTYTYNSENQILKAVEERSEADPIPWTIFRVINYEYDALGRILLYERDFRGSSSNQIYRQETIYFQDTILVQNLDSRNNQPFEGTWRRWRVPSPNLGDPDLYWRSDHWENGVWETDGIIRRTLQHDQYDNLIRVDEESFEDGQWLDYAYQTTNWDYREDGLPLTQTIVRYDYTTERSSPLSKKIWRYEDQKKRSTRPMIAITPNPSTGPLNISIHSAPALPTKWQIFDPTGKVVRSGDISEDEQLIGLNLVIDELQFGIYMVQIIFEDGSTVAKKWQKI